MLQSDLRLHDSRFMKTTAMLIGFSIACASPAIALPQFTFDPAAAGLTGTSFTADNIILSDFSTVVLTPNGSGGATFTDDGVLAIAGLQLGSSPVSSGLNSTFGLYFQFSSAGTQNTPTFQGNTQGLFSQLSYTLYGYNVTGAVSYQPADVTPGGVLNPVALASGSLIAGGVGATVVPGFPATPNANTLLSLNPIVAGFFASPTPFYNADFASFTNSPSEVSFNGTGFVITQGGGSANFLTLPEPASFAVFGAGILGLGLIRHGKSHYGKKGFSDLKHFT